MVKPYPINLDHSLQVTFKLFEDDPKKDTRDHSIYLESIFEVG
jgi:hypothetical protein